MTKELRCRDLGTDCEAAVIAESDEEVLSQVVAHGRSVHGPTDQQLGDPAQEQVRGQIHERV